MDARATVTPAAAEPPPWHAAFPAPQSTPDAVSREALLAMLREREGERGKKPHDFLAIDLRRDDHKVGFGCACYCMKFENLHGAAGACVYALVVETHRRRETHGCRLDIVMPWPVPFPPQRLNSAFHATRGRERC